MAQCPAELQHVHVFVALGRTQVDLAEFARHVRTTERHGDDDLRAREDVCASGERILEDRASLVGVRLGFGPTTGPPLDVAERRHDVEREHQHPALAHERVVLPPEHLACPVELPRPQESRPDRDRRSDLPRRRARQVLRPSQLGDAELDLMMAANAS